MNRRLLILLLCINLLLPGMLAHAVEAEPAQTAQTVPSETTPEASVPSETVPEETQPSEVLQNLLDKLTSKVTTEDQRIRQQIMRVHAKTLQETEEPSLGGKCGLQVGWELYLLGITNYAVTNNGKDHYDFFKDAGATSGGYPIRAYDAAEYSLEEALNLVSRNGTRNVYNILVGFEKTNTEAGQQFGHAIFIHGILGGKVYCVEGYTSRFGVAEGEPIVITIAQFAAWMESWTEYEGLIYFGKGNILDSYTAYDCDLFAQSDTPQEIRSEPQMGDVLRTVMPGERLRVTGMFEDLGGNFCYRVSDDGLDGYVDAQAFYPVLFCNEEAQQYLLEGQVMTRPAPDQTGETVAAAPETVHAEGWIYIDEKWFYLENGTTRTGWFHSQGHDYYFDETGAAVTGWMELGGVLRYFGDTGALRTGWIHRENGVQYLLRNGVPLTGWRTLEGERYCFDDQGYMLQNSWCQKDGALYYFGWDGKAVTGWVKIDGVFYGFSPEGNLLSKREGTGKNVRYIPYDGSWQP